MKKILSSIVLSGSLISGLNAVGIHDDFWKDVSNFENMVKNHFNNMHFKSINRNYLSTNIIEKKDKYLYEIEIPGIEKKDIKLSVDNGMINISFEKTNKYNKENNSSKILRSEISYGKYSRSFSAGKDFDLENITAKNKNGILTITIPKLEKINTEKIIEIK